MARRGDDAELRAKAGQVGVVAEYIDATQRRCVTSDRTRKAILCALGVGVPSQRARRSARGSCAAPGEEGLLDPVRILVDGAGQRVAARVRLLNERSGRIEWQLELVEESGRVHRQPGSRRIVAGRTALSIPISAELPHGYHTLRLNVRGPRADYRAEQKLIVAPPRCWTYREAMGERRSFGLWANLYSLRGGRSSGVGDLDALDALVRWAAKQGAAFVGINPLHAVAYAENSVSPYSPSSRQFRSPVYIDIESVPEFAACRTSGKRATSERGPAAGGDLDALTWIAYPQVCRAKLRALRDLYRVFSRVHGDNSTSRGRAYRDFVDTHGERLVEFATYEALADHFGRGGPGGGHCRWPAAFRDARSREVAEFRREHRDEIGLHCFLQFEIDRQLARSAGKAKALGMRLGLYYDIAVGSGRCGFDTWAHPDLFVGGVAMGCPPDTFSDEGQNWSFPPVNPLSLRRSGYSYWIACLRSAFAHAGMVRLDHVMGLFRQFWIPAGFAPTDGAYVRFPAAELLAILALESRRHRALVVGEDLGTVPRGLPKLLERRGILSTRVLYFERRRRGGFKPAGGYHQNAIAMATTHDHPSLAGFWTGRDLDIRRRHGLIDSEAALAEARAQRAADQRALVRRIGSHVGPQTEVGTGSAGAAGTKAEAEREVPTVTRGVYGFLSTTPCPLLAVSLDDLAGESDPVNIPGTDAKQYPNWRRRMKRSVQDIARDPTALSVLRAVRAGR